MMPMMNGERRIVRSYCDAAILARRSYGSDRSHILRKEKGVCSRSLVDPSLVRAIFVDEAARAWRLHLANAGEAGERTAGGVLGDAGVGGGVCGHRRAADEQAATERAVHVHLVLLVVGTATALGRE